MESKEIDFLVMEGGFNLQSYKIVKDRKRISNPGGKLKNRTKAKGIGQK
jgi:hypothetical protein